MFSTKLQCLSFDLVIGGFPEAAIDLLIAASARDYISTDECLFLRKRTIQFIKEHNGKAK